MTAFANGERPLFVPLGIPVVRTGPTTRAEFERLLEDDDIAHSRVRLIRPPGGRSISLLRALAEVLQLASPSPRSRHRIESR